jgi:predicted amidohydrolase YtcJ
VNHLDDTGVLAPGMRADLAVLDRDPFLGEPAQIAETKVLRTYVDGEPVFLAS